ncbi:MAG: hypothetical protein E7611_04470 [Ruminococcaceae bacterium]|nr:hypothetical protein [Oscillospiraceae bacterium]
MNKVSFVIRKITVPPVFAASLLIIAYIMYPSFFGSLWHLFGGLMFLCVLPLLAYPLQKFIPHFKDKGRDGQRTLAMIFSAVGYLLGTLVAFLTDAPKELKIIYLEYLLCGIIMIVFNKVFKLKASGHACGIVGPVLLMLFFKMYIPAIIGTLLIIPVYVSSLKTKRHTASQLIGGSFIPLASLVIINLLFFLLA